MTKPRKTAPRWISTRAVYEWDGERYVKIQDDGYWYDGPLALATDPPTMEVTNWAFYNEGTESGSVIIGSVNTNPSLDVDKTYFVRFGLEETSGNSSKNTAPQLQYNRNGGGWNNVAAASNVIRATATGSISDGSDTTQRITSFTHDTTNEGFDSGDGIAGGGNADLASDGFEALYSFQVRSADVSGGDTIVLKIVDSNNGDADYDVYNQTDPTVTVLVSLTISADYVASASAVQDPTLTTLATIDADYVASVAQVYDPAVTAEQTVSADYLASSSAVYEPTVLVVQTIEADYLASASAVYEPTLDGAAVISADYVASAAQVFDPTIIAVATISADYVASASQVYAPSLSGTQTIDAPYLASSSAVYEPTLVTPQFIEAEYLASASAVYEPTLAVEQTISADYLASASAVYQPTLAAGLFINADYVASAAQIYVPTISQTALGAARSGRREATERKLQTGEDRPAQTYSTRRGGDYSRRSTATNGRR